MAPDSKTVWGAFNIMVDDRRHAVVGTERKKGRVKLVALADIHWFDIVGEPHFLKGNGDFMAIGVGQ